MSIKSQIEHIQQQILAFQAVIGKLQDECPHPKFVQGLSMIGCIQPVYICEDCGFTKPMPIEEMEPLPPNQFWKLDPFDNIGT